TMTITFNNLQRTVETVVEILQNKIIPSTMEFIDASALKAVGDFSRIDFSGVKGMLLIEVDGSENEVLASVKKIESLSKKEGVLEFKLATTEQERGELWKTRRSISPAVGKLKPTKINEDITVPRNKLPELIRGVEKIAEKYNLFIVNFGHAGDGNIHVNIMTDKNNEEEYQKALKAVEEVFDLTLSMKGTISGEHGVGLAKQPYIAKELSVSEIEWMKRIKQIFDPNNIMNPGKIFP
ncbi:MAG: glycolate oxidase subunit GlcD, partial [Nitrospinae bacterium]|nr:glycolate oxidase subunit GlcD [Nitrospinota bacterium]